MSPLRLFQPDHLPIVVEGILNGHLDVAVRGANHYVLVNTGEWTKLHYQAVIGRQLDGRLGATLHVFSRLANGHTIDVSRAQWRELKALPDCTAWRTTTGDALARARVFKTLPAEARTNPPRGAHLLMYWMLPSKTREELIGDALEIYQEKMIPTFGLKAAKRWFWWEAMRSITAMLPWRMLKLLTSGWLVNWATRFISK